MGELRDFVADLLERQGAAVEALAPDGLEVLAPPSVQTAMGWPELARLSFGASGRDPAIAIGLEGDWLDRFATFLGDRGRWAERQLDLPGASGPPQDVQRILDRALDLPNATWRFQGICATVTPCLVLAFRYSAVSDEKREGLVRFGLNLGTGAVIDEVLSRLHPTLSDSQWCAPERHFDLAALAADEAALSSRVRLLVNHRVRQELEPFLRAMRRRLQRDRNRVHAYHDDLRSASLKKLAALANAPGEKAEADRRREKLRVAAIEREYQAKIDDLRHNYALQVAIEWVQALVLHVPVHRFDVLIRRRKGQRLIQLDFHPLARLIEPPPCDWGLGLDRIRLVCDEKLHLTAPEGQLPCPCCRKPWCRSCHPAACPRCGTIS